MTKEEIRKVLDLALEYYKLEIFGTGKESQPQTQERIDYIYDRMQQSLPSDLDEAAIQFTVKRSQLDSGSVWCTGDIGAAFKAGAEWMAGQGHTKETQVYANRWTDVDEVIVNLGQGEFGFKAGDKVIVQIRKK